MKFKQNLILLLLLTVIFIYLSSFEKNFFFPVKQIQPRVNKFLVNLKTIYQNEPLFDSNQTVQSASSVFQALTDNHAILIFLDQSDLNQTKQLTFMIEYLNFKRFYHTISASFPSCSQTLIKTNYFELNIISSLYLQCESINLQISIYYEREKFWWLPQDDFVLGKKILNDKPRAFKKLKTKKIPFLDYQVNIVEDKVHFLYEYKNSEFIECRTREVEPYETKTKHNLSKKQRISDVLFKTVDIIESSNVNYWVVGDSLAEWIDYCDFIFGTDFVDIGILETDFKSVLKKSVESETKSHLNSLNETRGFRLGLIDFWIDLSLIYELNRTHYFKPDRKKINEILPKFTKLCSAQILNEKFPIPCYK